jgi:signal transduction histidine kinase
MQSHVVRAPVARMLGLVDLINTDEDIPQEELKLYLDKIVSSAKELDAHIREISNKATTINYIKN